MLCPYFRGRTNSSLLSLCLSPFCIEAIGRHQCSSVSFIPKHSPAKEEDVDRLNQLLVASKNIVILTGAGISTESGIPDYRSEGVGLYARSTNRPVQFRDFLKSEAVRKRYWTRNFVGWPRFSSFQPNSTHLSITKLSNEMGIVKRVITQNVDSLHSKAGTKNVIELHGTAFRVVCLDCNFSIERHAFQTLLAHLNPGMKIIDQMIRPDGDVELDQVS